MLLIERCWLATCGAHAVRMQCACSALAVHKVQHAAHLVQLAAHRLVAAALWLVKPVEQRADFWVPRMHVDVELEACPAVCHDYPFPDCAVHELRKTSERGVQIDVSAGPLTRPRLIHRPRWLPTGQSAVQSQREPVRHRETIDASRALHTRANFVKLRITYYPLTLEAPTIGLGHLDAAFNSAASDGSVATCCRSGGTFAPRGGHSSPLVP